VNHAALDPDAIDPLYVQLAAILRGQIERGELTRRVPSVKSLAQEYECSIGTAERALAILKEEGLVATSMGRGAFVIPKDQRPKR
jgi:GntR family transcriptional regulator